MKLRVLYVLLFVAVLGGHAQSTEGGWKPQDKTDQFIQEFYGEEWCQNRLVNDKEHHQSLRALVLGGVKIVKEENKILSNTIMITRTRLSKPEIVSINELEKMIETDKLNPLYFSFKKSKEGLIRLKRFTIKVNY